MNNIAQHVIQAAHRHPQAIAVIDRTLSRYQATRWPGMSTLGYTDAPLSYQAFIHRFSRLAKGFQELSYLQQGDRVLMCIENRPEYFDIVFACWCLGLCVVPVNAKLHPKEIMHILMDCGAKLAILGDKTVSEVQELVLAEKNTIQVIEAGSKTFADLYVEEPMVCQEVDARDTAWLFYTSGTTGKPKGAMLSHQNLLEMAFAYEADIEQVKPGDTLFHAAPLSHGSGLYAIPHLLGGGQQVIFDGFEPVEILAELKQSCQVSFFAAPTMVVRLLGAIEPQQTYDNLRTLIYGGAPMYVNDLVKALECFGPKLYGLYGQGESPMTISGLSKEAHQGDFSPEHLARLAAGGLPRTGVQVRVVDQDGVDVPTGQLGEIITKNLTVMQGYWNNPQATAQALRDGWLWTGDIGRLDDQGFLYLTDRSKDLIISGGSNIYPREIEEVLLLHPSVAECSVVGRNHDDWGEEVVAFVVPRGGQMVLTDELDQLCLDHIARFKRPKAYFVVEALPKNNYGKILKTELRQQLKQTSTHPE
jgi:long-chain acyl-CoA synthetase